jgi:hypothetical protein
MKDGMRRKSDELVFSRLGPQYLLFDVGRFDLSSDACTSTDSAPRLRQRQLFQRRPPLCREKFRGFQFDIKTEDRPQYEILDSEWSVASRSRLHYLLHRRNEPFIAGSLGGLIQNETANHPQRPKGARQRYFQGNGEPMQVLALQSWNPVPRLSKAAWLSSDGNNSGYLFIHDD